MSHTPTDNAINRLNRRIDENFAYLTELMYVLVLHLFTINNQTHTSLGYKIQVLDNNWLTCNDIVKCKDNGQDRVCSC